ncbi:uroporphyrinogen-III synthase [Papilio machaon]|uniref:uroporphyrinogen-III synthase n=1 Tax=Papilio machaon TaxID=76193 RepID=UPI001E662DD8|nr:uroporphyrinogen-III synthase [Papilio machaon]XP_014364617.2 uroporphyrinogen-III synthase [Papilio machaon]
MKKVLLFKSASEDYVKAFSEHNYQTVFIEPLQFVYVNLQELSEKLQSLYYQGLILTSPRAIESVSKCWAPSKFVTWNTKRIYTVGESSARKVKLLLGLEALGTRTGNAENLAKLILQENSSPSNFLFPCGNLSSELLPSKLHSGGITLDSLTVYETKENENLRSDLMRVNEDAEVCCMVFFSPSGCEYVQRQLQTFSNKLAHLPHFAIGNSTAHKIENLGLEIAGVAAKPKAENVLESVEHYFRTL